MKTFEEAFNGKRAVLVNKFDVTIDLLEKLRDNELLTKLQFQQLKIERDRKPTSEVLSTLLDMLEKFSVKYKRVDRLQLFCDILRDEGQPHIADILTTPVTPQPANEVKTKKPDRLTQNGEAMFLIGDRPLLARVCSLVTQHKYEICIVFAIVGLLLVLISVGGYFIKKHRDAVNPSKEKPFQKILEDVQEKFGWRSIGLPPVRKNSTSYIDLVHPYTLAEISAHIQRMIFNASIALQDTLRKIDVDQKVEAYKTFVRPILEKASSLWNPDSRKDIEDIENVQREFVDSVIDPDDQMSYKQKLEHLGLESFEVRRLRAILMHAYMIAFDLVDVDKEGFFVLTTDKARGGHNYRLELRGSPAGQLFHFSSTAVITWNKLPADEVDFSCIEAFEKSLTSDVLLTLC